MEGSVLLTRGAVKKKRAFLATVENKSGPVDSRGRGEGQRGQAVCYPYIQSQKMSVTQPVGVERTVRQGCAGGRMARKEQERLALQAQ